jgi:hypothetical protein
VFRRYACFWLDVGRWLLDLLARIWRWLVVSFLIVALRWSEPEAMGFRAAGSSINKRPLSCISVACSQGMEFFPSVRGELEMEDLHIDGCWATNML